jgi:hypothetical protein
MMIVLAATLAGPAFVGGMLAHVTLMLVPHLAMSAAFAVIPVVIVVVVVAVIICGIGIVDVGVGHGFNRDYGTGLMVVMMMVGAPPEQGKRQKADGGRQNWIGSHSVAPIVKPCMRASAPDIGTGWLSKSNTANKVRVRQIYRYCC